MEVLTLRVISRCVTSTSVKSILVLAADRETSPNTIQRAPSLAAIDSALDRSIVETGSPEACCISETPGDEMPCHDTKASRRRCSKFSFARCTSGECSNGRTRYSELSGQGEIQQCLTDSLATTARHTRPTA